MTLWRQISDTLAEEINDGVLTPGERLSASSELAARFGVNRHTVLKAVSHLQEEGLLRTERGGGIYVEDVIPYRMGARTRLEENLLELNKVPSRKILSVVNLRAPKPVAAALNLARGDDVVLVTMIGAADDIPVSYGQNYFPLERLPGIADAYHETTRGGRQPLSTRAVLEAQGVKDFKRRMIRIGARMPTPVETRKLRIARNETVFQVNVTNVDADGVPIVYGETSFCSSRVEFVMEF